MPSCLASGPLGPPPLTTFVMWRMANRLLATSGFVATVMPASATAVPPLKTCSPPVSLIAAVALDYLPTLSLVAILPSLILLPKPLGWAFKQPLEPVPIPALGANVIWNLSTNVVLALTLFV